MQSTVWSGTLVYIPCTLLAYTLNKYVCHTANVRKTMQILFTILLPYMYKQQMCTSNAKHILCANYLTSIDGGMPIYTPIWPCCHQWCGKKQCTEMILNDADNMFWLHRLPMAKSLISQKPDRRGIRLTCNILSTITKRFNDYKKVPVEMVKLPFSLELEFSNEKLLVELDA